MTQDKHLLLPVTLVRNGFAEAAMLSFVSHAAYPELSRRVGDILRGDEASYYATLTEERRKKDFLTGRASAKKALAALLDQVCEQDIEIKRGVFLQPVVALSGNDPLAVSISHGGRISAAISYPAGHPCGLDLEMISSNDFHVMQSAISVEELPHPKAGVTEAQRYTRAWSVKEALSKILCCGLTVPFPLLNIGSETAWDGEIWRGRFCNFPQYVFLSLATEGMVFSMVHPARTKVECDFHRVMAFMADNRTARGQGDVYTPLTM